MKKYLLLMLVLVLVSACSIYNFSGKVVEQGNKLEMADVQKIHIGMSRDAVVQTLGATLLDDSADKIEYAYTLERPNNKPEIKYLIIYFSKDKVVKIDKKL
jgi:outer membrane protein assembly factor BamE (lipoprotein component of BamABCDE complex)